MVVGARQSFQFFRQITWFLGNNRALSKFRYQILHNLISITKFYKNHSVKANFKLSTRATLAVEIFCIKKSKQLSKEWFVIPKVLLSQTLNYTEINYFTLEIEKYKLIHLASIYASLSNIPVEEDT